MPGWGQKLIPLGVAVAVNEVIARLLIGALDHVETQVLACMVDGMSTRDSALLLGITLTHLDSVRASVMAKLNANTSADAVRIGLYAGVGFTDWRRVDRDLLVAKMQGRVAMCSHLAAATTDESIAKTLRAMARDIAGDIERLLEGGGVQEARA